jgi:hypothetical protein
VVWFSPNLDQSVLKIVEGLTDPRLAGILPEKFSGTMLFEK